jgi:hypothetical protein
MQNMCAWCRILHDPILFRYLLMMEEKPLILGWLLQYKSLRTQGLWQLDLILRSYLGSHMSTLIPANASVILQSMRWWIFLIGIPYTMWCICRSPNWNEPLTASGMSPIWNIDKSLPKLIGGSPFQYGDWLFWCFFSHTQDWPFLTKN